MGSFGASKNDRGLILIGICVSLHGNTLNSDKISASPILISMTANRIPDKIYEKKRTNSAQLINVHKHSTKIVIKLIYLYKTSVHHQTEGMCHVVLNFYFLL